MAILPGFALLQFFFLLEALCRLTHLVLESVWLHVGVIETVSVGILPGHSAWALCLGTLPWRHSASITWKFH